MLQSAIRSAQGLGRHPWNCRRASAAPHSAQRLKMSLVAEVRDAAQQGGPAQLARAVAALPAGNQDVLQHLLDGLYAAIIANRQKQAESWQQACLRYLETCSEADLAGWRWAVQDWTGNESAEVELVPFLLHGSRATIRKVHYERLLQQEQEYDEDFQDDPDVDDWGFLEGAGELAQGAFNAFQDCMEMRDELMRPLLEAAVRRGAAALPLAVARSLDKQRDASWGGAGAGWAERWEPVADVHARFHPRFRRAARTLLLANHRGWQGAASHASAIHLPPEVLLKILRCMAAPEAEAAYVVGQLPGWVDLNSDF